MRATRLSKTTESHGITFRGRIGWPAAVVLSIVVAAVSGRALSGSDAGRSSGEAGDTIEIAIVLDTSSSMRGLIDSVRFKLWEIVDDLGMAEPTPRLRLALLTYGNTENPVDDGWVRIESDLTDDLDLISERLLALTSDGGTELVGRALQRAVDELTWTSSEEALKMIFIAGNERVSRGSELDYRSASAATLSRGIALHVLFCGDPEREEDTAAGWREMAELAEGQFTAIDQRLGATVVDSPFDEELTTLSEVLSETYLPFGDRGFERLERTLMQDRRARELSLATAAGRAEVKSDPRYAESWDLVSAVEGDGLFLYELPEGALPRSLEEMGFRELESFVSQRQLVRQEIRERVQELSSLRRRHIEAEIEARGLDTSRAFDTVVRQAVRARAEERGFQFRDR